MVLIDPSDMTDLLPKQEISRMRHFRVDRERLGQRHSASDGGYGHRDRRADRAVRDCERRGR